MRIGEPIGALDGKTFDHAREDGPRSAGTLFGASA
jgi:hypothetical protein